MPKQSGTVRLIINLPIKRVRGKEIGGKGKCYETDLHDIKYAYPARERNY